MRAVTDYVIGNTAVRIVDTGRKLRVIDVAKEHEKKQFRKVAVATLLAALLTLGSSLSVVDYHSTHTMLDKHVYSLKSEVETLEYENKCLRKKINENTLTYDEIYKKATALGMHLPKRSHVKSYTFKKGTGIKVYQRLY
ncbi:MAG: hypothetical protein J5819_06480 [Eubacterium sp.]|nr:hypothetical protein [Eubacterium sp.]